VESTSESEEADKLLRQNAIEINVTLLQGRIKLRYCLAPCWKPWFGLGEYGDLSAVATLDDMLCSLSDIVSTAHQLHSTTREFLVSAIMKLVAQSATRPTAIIDDFTKSHDVQLQQPCLEFQSILTSAQHVWTQILPVHASAEDVEVDTNLSFLENYVNAALRECAKPYDRSQMDDDDDDEDNILNPNSPAKAAALT
jgi:AP-4 complex subunit epsilon-1